MRLTTKLLARQLRNSALPKEDRVFLTNLMLESLNVVRIRDIIRVQADGTLEVNGQSLDFESSIRLREGARMLSESQVRKFLQDSVAFRAIQLGVHKALTPEELIFSKAALWWGEQENELLKILAE